MPGYTARPDKRELEDDLPYVVLSAIFYCLYLSPVKYTPILYRIYPAFTIRNSLIEAFLDMQSPVDDSGWDNSTTFDPTNVTTWECYDRDSAATAFRINPTTRDAECYSNDGLKCLWLPSIRACYLKLVTREGNLLIEPLRPLACNMTNSSALVCSPNPHDIVRPKRDHWQTLRDHGDKSSCASTVMCVTAIVVGIVLAIMTVRTLQKRRELLALQASNNANAAPFTKVRA